MSSSRKNGSPLLREVMFKAPAPVTKTKKSLNDIDEMYTHPRNNPKYKHLFTAKPETKSTEADKPVTEETSTPKPNNP